MSSKYPRLGAEPRARDRTEQHSPQWVTVWVFADGYLEVQDHWAVLGSPELSGFLRAL